jgi:uncharacterized protein (DUF4415 family)
MSKSSVETIRTRYGREFILNTPAEDAAITAAALADPDAQPMSDERLACLKPAREVLSPALVAAFSKSKGGRPKSENPKVFTGIRLSPEVAEAFRATGKGWQTRMNAALADWLKTHSPLDVGIPEDR